MANPIEEIEAAVSDRDQAVERLHDAIRSAAYCSIPIARIARAACMSRTHVRRIIEAR